MKKTGLVVLAVAAVLIVTLIACLVWYKGAQSAQEIVGSWMLYEGGYVAPEVLTFNADGTGTAYALTDAYQDNSMTDVQIPRSCLEQAEPFQWRIEDGTLTFVYESGKQESLGMSFDTTFAVPILSLDEGFGSGGWVPAEIVD